MKNKIKESISGQLKSIKSSWVFNNKLLIITFIWIYFHTQGYVFGERHLRTSRDVECLVGDCINGQGVALSVNGTQYVGEFKDGAMNGQGQMSYVDGAQYVGEFKDRIKHGQGTYTYPDGQTYVGEWKDGIKHGHMTITWPDGRLLVTEFEDGDCNGYGIQYDKDGDVSQSGLFVEVDNLFTLVVKKSVDEVRGYLNAKYPDLETP